MARRSLACSGAVRRMCVTMLKWGEADTKSYFSKPYRDLSPSEADRLRSTVRFRNQYFSYSFHIAPATHTQVLLFQLDKGVTSLQARSAEFV